MYFSKFAGAAALEIIVAEDDAFVCHVLCHLRDSQTKPVEALSE